MHRKLTACASLVIALCSLSDKSCAREYAGAMVEAKAGYFIFSSSHMRDVFDGGFGVQGSGSFPVWRWLHIYGSIGYLEQSGKSSLKYKTTIWELPVDIGLKPVFNLSKRVQYYFAIGPRYFYFHQHNHSPYVDKNIHKNGIGFFVNTGFNFKFSSHFFLDAFGEYSYQKIDLSPSKHHVYATSTQVGGFLFGGGIGYAF